jgi:glutaminase
MHQNKAVKVSEHDMEISPILSSLQEIHAKYQRDFSGKVATYIPELAKADPSLFGIALVTADGQVYQTGDANLVHDPVHFETFVMAWQKTMGSITYSVKWASNPRRGISSIVRRRRNRPFNPMVNAGKIATTGLVKGTGQTSGWPGCSESSPTRGLPQHRSCRLYFRRTTGHRNRAIGYLELNRLIAEPVNEHLDLYFEQCSILVSARRMAATWRTTASILHRQAPDELHINVERHVQLRIRHAGEWSYRIGLPAKSGVGGELAVLPGQFGIRFLRAARRARQQLPGIQVCEGFERQTTHVSKPCGHWYRRAPQLSGNHGGLGACVAPRTVALDAGRVDVFTNSGKLSSAP